MELPRISILSFANVLKIHKKYITPQINANSGNKNKHFIGVFEFHSLEITLVATRGNTMASPFIESLRADMRLRGYSIYKIKGPIKQSRVRVAESGL